MRGLRISADNSAVTGNVDWNLGSAPASATVGSKTSALGDGSVPTQQGWLSKRSLTGLAANAVFQAVISRDSASTDGTEPQLGFRDLRIYDAVSNAFLPTLFVSNSSATSATVWFKTGASSSGIYAYYGNAGAALSDPSLPANLVPVVLPAPSLGRNEPVTLLNGGKYTISGCLKSDLNKGQLIFNFNPMATTIPIIDSKSGATNSAFNRDGAWHCLSETVTSTVTTVNANSHVRAYLTPSTGDSATIPASFPDGVAYLDDLSVTPYYGLTATRFSERQIDLAWTHSSYDATG